jgi:hypothetical protein
MNKTWPKIPANIIAKAMNKCSSGIDYTGCTKHELYETITRFESEDIESVRRYFNLGLGCRLDIKKLYPILDKIEAEYEESSIILKNKINTILKETK